MNSSSNPKETNKTMNVSSETRWPYLISWIVTLLVAISIVEKQDLLKQRVNDMISWDADGRHMSPAQASTNATFESMRERYRQSCPQHQFQTRIFSTDPLIIYLENFIGKDEAKYILNVA